MAASAIRGGRSGVRAPRSRGSPRDLAARQGPDRRHPWPGWRRPPSMSPSRARAPRRLPAGPVPAGALIAVTVTAALATLQPPLRAISRSTAETEVWAELRAEAEAALIEEPLYAGIIQATILDQRTLAQAWPTASPTGWATATSPACRCATCACRLRGGSGGRLPMRCATSSPSASATRPVGLPGSLPVLQGLRRAGSLRVGHWLWQRAGRRWRCMSRAASRGVRCDIHRRPGSARGCSSTTPPGW